MQETGIYHWIHRNSLQVFIACGAVSLVFLIAGLLSDYEWLSLAPLAILAGILFIIRPFLLFWTLLVVLPISMEYEIGSFGTDLPSEPLAIFMAGLAALWLISQPANHLKVLLGHPFSKVLLIHLFWAAVCMVFAGKPVISLKYFLSKTWYLLGFFIGAYWILKYFRIAVMGLEALAAVTVLSILYVMYEHYPWGFTFDSINIACNPLYRNHVTYGVFLAMVLPLLFFIRSQTNSEKISRLLVNSGILITLAGIWLSYTRGAWLAIPVMLLVYLVISKQWTRFLFPVAIVAAVAFFTFLAIDNRYLNFAPNYEDTIYHEDLGEHLNATFEGKDMSTMERFHRWIAAFRISAEHPVFGVGPNNFVDFYKPYTVSAFETYISDNDERSTVHNYFILMMAEQGVPGLLIALALIGVFFLHAEKVYPRLKHTPYRYLYMACILCGSAFWLNNLFSDLLEANKLAPLYFIILAVMMRVEEWDRKKAVKGA